MTKEKLHEIANAIQHLQNAAFTIRMNLSSDEEKAKVCEKYQEAIDAFCEDFNNIRSNYGKR